jgi:hypothetical protein
MIFSNCLPPNDIGHVKHNTPVNIGPAISKAVSRISGRLEAAITKHDIGYNPSISTKILLMVLHLPGTVQDRHAIPGAHADGPTACDLMDKYLRV